MYEVLRGFFISTTLLVFSDPWWPCLSFWPCCCSNPLPSTSWTRWMLLWIFPTHRTLDRCCARILDTHRSVQPDRIYLLFGFKIFFANIVSNMHLNSPSSLWWCPWRTACSPTPTSCLRPSSWTACPQCPGPRSARVTQAFHRRAKTRLVRKTRGSNSSPAKLHHVT